MRLPPAVAMSLDRSRQAFSQIGSQFPAGINPTGNGKLSKKSRKQSEGRNPSDTSQGFFDRLTDLLCIILCLCVPKLIVCSSFIYYKFFMGTFLHNLSSVKHCDVVAESAG